MREFAEVLEEFQIFWALWRAWALWALLGTFWPSAPISCRNMRSKIQKNDIEMRLCADKRFPPIYKMTRCTTR